MSCVRKCVDFCPLYMNDKTELETGVRGVPRDSGGGGEEVDIRNRHSFLFFMLKHDLEHTLTEKHQEGSR